MGGSGRGGNRRGGIDARPLRSAETNQFDVPRRRTKFGESAFAVAGTREWNALPDNIPDNISELSTFKRAIKTYNI